MLISDDRLTRQAIAGDERAFGAIYSRYQESLYRYCLAIVGNPEDAQDALQNTMVKVMRALPGEDRRIELKPWLYRIAHNESIELIRRRRPNEELDPELLAAGAGLAEEASQRQRLRSLLGDIEQLPERQRGALVMRELGGLGFEEIGAALGTTAATARQTLYEARLGLREMDAGREMSCEEVMRAVSDADGRVLRRRDIRTHLRTCPACSAFRDEIGGRQRDFAALSPLPAAAAAALLQGLLGAGGGGAAAAGGGLATAVGSGAAKTVGASAVMKGLAAVAVVAAVGVTAADRGGLVHVGLPGDGGSGGAAKTVTPAGGSSATSSPPQGTPASAAVAKKRGEASSGAADLGKANAVAKNAGSGLAGAADPGAAEPGPSEEATAQEFPGAAAHGQQTAASHKSAKSHAAAPHPAHPPKPARSAHPAQPSHPPKPSHPAHPTHPAAPAASKESPAAPAPEASLGAEKGASGSAAAQVDEKPNRP